MKKHYHYLKIKTLIILFFIITIKTYSQVTIYQTGFENGPKNVFLGINGYSASDYWRVNDLSVQHYTDRCLYNDTTHGFIQQMDSTRNAWCLTEALFSWIPNQNFASINKISLGICAMSGWKGINVYEKYYYCDMSPILRSGVFDYFNDLATDRWAYRVIPTIGKTDITLSFSWKCAGLEGLDYGQVGYSIDYGKTWKWLTTGGCNNTGQYSGCYSPISKVQTANISFPAECNNTSKFAIAFRFKSSGNGQGTGPTFIIDDIIVKGSATCNPASFTKQPLNVSVCSPSSASFTVATAGEGIVSHQWQVNNGSWTNLTNGGTRPAYSGSTSTQLNVTNPIATLQYRCIAKNCSGNSTATSNAVTLTVNLPPTSKTVFVKQIKTIGDAITYTVNPGGTGSFSYQWIKTQNDITNNINGATNNVYSINSIECQDSGLYTCNITNMCKSIISKVAELYVPNCSRFKFAISGYVKYNNKDSSILSSRTNNTITNIALLNMGDTLIENTQTDDNGFYVFVNVVNGDYKLVGSTTKRWSGGNPVDALLISKNYIGTYSITDPLKKIAGDVSGDGNIMPGDALLVNRRYIGLQDKFPVSDWRFSNPTIKVETEHITKNIRAICAGDVNASYSNIPAKSLYKNINLNSGIIKINYGKTFDLPVYLNDFVELGAIGIKLKNQNSKLKILDLTSDIDGLIYKITCNGVNVAWSMNNQGYKITPDKPLFFVRCSLVVDRELNEEEISNSFQLTTDSEIADFDANLINTDKLVIPKISYDSRLVTNDLKFINYPNPFSSNTNIIYTLPEDANVKLIIYNLLGETVATITDEMQNAGQYSLQFNGSSLKQGIYYCKIDAINNTSAYSRTNILMIAR